MAINLASGVIYTGTDDKKLNLAYNSFIIKDEKVAVLDIPDVHVGEQWKLSLQQGLGGCTPDYLVLHDRKRENQPLVDWVAASYPGIRVLSEDNIADGDILDLGVHKLHFYAVRGMLVSFDSADKVLYSADIFGKYGALSNYGFTNSEDRYIEPEVRRYFTDLPDRNRAGIRTLLEKLGSLQIEKIRPLHGTLLESDVERYLSLYKDWSREAGQ